MAPATRTNDRGFTLANAKTIAWKAAEYAKQTAKQNSTINSYVQNYAGKSAKKGDSDEEDAWGDVKAAKNNIAKYDIRQEGDDFEFGDPSAGGNRPPPTTFDFDSMKPKDILYKDGPTYGEAFTGARIHQSKVPPKYNCTSVPGGKPPGSQDRHVMSEREVRERYKKNSETGQQRYDDGYGSSSPRAEAPQQSADFFNDPAP